MSHLQDLHIDLLRRDSEISDLGEIIFFYTSQDESDAFLTLDLTLHNICMLLWKMDLYSLFWFI